MTANTQKMYRRDGDEKCDEGGHCNSRMKVVVRIRPETEAELHTGYPIVVKAVDDHVLVFDPKPDNTPTVGHCCVGEAKQFKKPLLPSKKHKDLRLGFDRVFDATGTQMEVFEHTTKDVVNDLLNGINCSVFAYGATGAGKTHTMLGDSSSPGVMFYTMLELYTKIYEHKEEKTCEVGVSYLEIYNETIRDLIVPSGALELREDYNQGLVVSGLTMHQPKTADEILNFLTIGNRNRTQHPTDANASSSRSHAVFQIYVNQKSRTSGVSTVVTQGKLSLIDLAGSERATVTTNRGARLREGANINKSLLALGNCINALAENKGKGTHIPYRNSKLTRLLKDSLGGNCRTVMITNISPSGLSYEDTYNTLKYASRAQQIKTTLARNVVNVDLHVTKYRSIIYDLQNEISELKQKLQLQGKTSSCAGPVHSSTDVIRLEEMVHSVYSERSHLRKAMSDLDAAERDVLLRVYRKERDLERIRVSSNSDAKRTKTQSQMDTAQSHLGEVQRQKQIIHDRLQSNRDCINELQHQISRAVGAAGPNGSALKRHMEMVIESRKLDVEGAHQWKQIKHLLKYIKAQEKQISKTEKILLHALELVSKQHQLLTTSSPHLIVPPSMEGLYHTLMRMAEGEREVLWADQSFDVSQDTSAILVQSQKNILDTMVMYCSPTVKKESPLGSLGGILTKRSCLSVATELNSSDADSSVTGVSCYSSSYNPRLLLSERRGAEVGLDQSHRAAMTQNGGEGGRGGGECISLREPSATIVEDAGPYGLTSRCGAFKSGSNAISSSCTTKASTAWIDPSRTTDSVGSSMNAHASQPAKLNSTSHLRRTDDAQSQPGHSVPRGTAADLQPPHKSSFGSAFKPLSQQPHASSLVRRTSSLSRATMIQSPPPSRSRATATSAAAATTDPLTAVTSKPVCKTLPPPTPHFSAAGSNRNASVGFEDNFVSPMVLKSQTVRAGPSAFSRSADQGCNSLTLSPPQRKSKASDPQCTSTASSPPQNAPSDGNQSASSPVQSSLSSPAGDKQENVGCHPSPLAGGSPPKDKKLPSLDLNSTFTIASLLSTPCGALQGNGSHPPSTLASSTLTTGIPLCTEHLGDLGQRVSPPSAVIHPESVAHKGNATDPSGTEHNSSTLQLKKAPSFMALTKSATYKRVQSAWTRMNVNKENEITAGPVLVRSLSKSKRLQSLSGSNLGKQTTSTL